MKHGQPLAFTHRQPEYYGRALVLAASIGVHAALLVFLLATFATLGRQHGRGVPGASGAQGLPAMQLIAIAEDVAPIMPPKPLPKPSHVALPDNALPEDALPDDLLPRPPEFEINTPPAPNASATTASAPNVSGTGTPQAPGAGAPAPLYDDPYAGATVRGFNTLALQELPKALPTQLPAQLSAPKADTALHTGTPSKPVQLVLNQAAWQAFVTDFKKRATARFTLSLLVQVGAQGTVLQCQGVGGTAPPEVQALACSELIAKPLFDFEGAPTRIWQLLPEIVAI
jgi:hypothetical protein